MVSRVPAHTELLDALCTAGFVGIQFVKFTETPWFVVSGVGLREVKAVGYRPMEGSTGDTRQVLYKGPFEEARDDAGNVYSRGRRVDISAAAWEQLRQGPAGDQFLFQGTDAVSGCSPCP
jgi:hypothetical protein